MAVTLAIYTAGKGERSKLGMRSRGGLRLLLPYFQFTKGTGLHSVGTGGNWFSLTFSLKQVLTIHFSLSLDEILNRSHK